ncbi:YqaH family protein [Bacillus pumilus]|uniref:YqaH family protein n=1 Tax=Bacillus pumilus TaxID=1408 RepID=UPI0023DC7CC8|nr:YqaH family protein [Bacillus pumilus]MDF2002733.1 YqaH family protein [Bacillus pumilus]MDF2025723.1 YqaH family protein [Bacillus pumilus]MDF2027615.1 YqaH family protein [Bacillus pumilus]MDF2090609.1 YqaH family protein [Bacillus pumilus]
MIEKQFLKEDLSKAKAKIDSINQLLHLAHQALKDGDYEELASLAGSVEIISEDLMRIGNKGRLIKTAEEIQQKYGVRLELVKRNERTEIIEY